MKAIFSKALVAAGFAVTVAGAQAGMIVFDDFEKKTVGQATAYLGVASTNTGATTYFSDRVVSITAVNFSNDGQQYVTAEVKPSTLGNGTGQLSISNNGGVESTVRVAYSGLNLPSNITAYEITIANTKIDVGQVTVGGAPTRLASAFSSTPISLGMFTTALGSSFAFNITSGIDTDALFDNLTIKYTCAAGAGQLTGNALSSAINAQNDSCSANVPVPASVALLGLGLLGLGLKRRKQ